MYSNGALDISRGDTYASVIFIGIKIRHALAAAFTIGFLRGAVFQFGKGANASNLEVCLPYCVFVDFSIYRDFSVTHKIHTNCKIGPA